MSYDLHFTWLIQTCVCTTNPNENHRSRIYGDKAIDIINGLKNHPAIVVPIVLERLKEKDVEWKEKIKQFRRHWRDQDLYLLKSLDYQAINFRPKDAGLTRPKALLCQLDSIIKVMSDLCNMEHWNFCINIAPACTIINLSRLYHLINLKISLKFLISIYRSDPAATNNKRWSHIIGRISKH